MPRLANKKALADAKLDAKSFVLLGVSFLQAGEALGHNAVVDATMLTQTAAAINATPKGVKVRLTHPGLPDCGGWDGVEVTMGRARNARVDGDKVRGDIELGSYASLSPAGDLRAYIMTLAQEDPELIGLSIAFEEDEAVELPRDPGSPEDSPVKRLMRVKSVQAVDFVGDPAANRDGLLSRVSTSLSKGLPPEQLAGFVTYLRSFGAVEIIKTLLNEKPKQENVMPATNTAETAEVKQPTETELAAAREKARRDEIKEIVTLSKLGEDWANLRILNLSTVEAARKEALETLSKASPNVNTIHVGDDKAVTSLRQDMEDAVSIKLGWGVKTPSNRAMLLSKKRFSGIITAGLSFAGINDLGDAEAVKLSFNRREVYRRVGNVGLSHSTSDFPSILQDALGKQLRAAYEGITPTWSKWAARRTAPDFRSIKSANISDFPALQLIKEGGELKYVALSDGKETYVLSKYEAGIILTWEAALADDLGAFARLPRAAAMRALQTEDEVAYAVKVNNAAMSDTGTIYNATAVTTAGGHANYTSSGSAITVASLGVGRATMMKQTGPKGTKLNIMPAVLNVGPDKLTEAQQLIASLVDPSKSNSTNNPFAGNLEVVGSAHLTGNTWYLDASPSVAPAYEVAFLESEQQPVIIEEEGMEVDGRKYKVRHSVAAACVEWRSTYKNAGA